jgi:CheY-like chemotaxis protein
VGQTHILLIEDNPGDIFLVERALLEHHIPHQLHVVKDGAEALAFVEHMGLPGAAPCPDVMLLDMNLPKIDGPEILTEFRKHPSCIHTPVIVLSSSDTQKDRARMEELGIARYFKKPSSLEEFLKLGSMIREVFEQGAARE